MKKSKMGIKIGCQKVSKIVYAEIKISTIKISKM
jgi:hypothetical protein